MFVGAVGVARAAPGVRRCALRPCCDADAAVACEQRKVLMGGALLYGLEGNATLSSVTASM